MSPTGMETVTAPVGDAEGLPLEGSTPDVILESVVFVNPHNKWRKGISLQQTLLHCPDCSYSCHDSRKLATHIFERADGPPRKCEDCNFKSCTTSEIQSHRRESHDIVRPIVDLTQDCKDSVPTVSSNKSRGSSPIQQAKLEENVPKCGYALRRIIVQRKCEENPATLRIRKRGRNKLCTFCRKRFQTKYGLEYHMRGHTGERPFQCQYCEFSSKSMYSLHIHTQIHKRKEPLKCGSCSASFSKQRHLSKHSNQIHAKM